MEIKRCFVVLFHILMKECQTRTDFNKTDVKQISHKLPATLVCKFYEHRGAWISTRSVFASESYRSLILHGKPWFNDTDPVFLSVFYPTWLASQTKYLVENPILESIFTFTTCVPHTFQPTIAAKNIGTPFKNEYAFLPPFPYSMLRIFGQFFVSRETRPV